MATDAEVVARIKAVGIQQFKSDMRDAGRSMSDLKGFGLSAMNAVQFGFRVAANAARVLVTGIGAIGVAMVGLGVVASKTNADFEALKMGLTAVLGSTKAMEIEWRRIREIAKLPGMGMEEAAQGIIRLVSTGMQLSLAERSLKAFGNALATVGGGKAELEGVALALTQIVSKGKVSAEEINQIAERVPQIRRAMIAAFGTADTETLQKMGITPEAFIEPIVTQLEKLPKVTGGAKNAFENLGDAIKIAFDSAGGVINTVVVPAINRMAEILSFLTERGYFEKITHGAMQAANAVAQMFGGSNNFEENIFRLLATLEVGFQRLPVIVKNVAQLFGEAMDFIFDKLNVFIRILNGLRHIPGVGTIAGLVFGEIPELNKKTFQDLGDRVFGGNFGSMVDQKQKALLDAWKASQKAGTPALPAVPEVPGMAPVTRPLEQIADYSRQIAANTAGWEEFRRYIVGGSERARKGLTPVDIAGRGGARPVVNISGGRGELEKAFENWLATKLRELARAGIIEV